MRPADLVELLQRYADVIEPDDLAVVASALPADERGGSLQELVGEVLKRAPSHSLLTRLAEADDSQANLYYVWRRRAFSPPSELPVVRIALMSSFTIEPLAYYLDAECRILGLEPQIYITPFNSWAQEVLDEHSDLRLQEAPCGCLIDCRACGPDAEAAMRSRG